MIIRIHATDLPGSSWDAYTNIAVGLQRRDQPDQLTSADSESATFVAEVEVFTTPAGPDFRGPHIHGKPRARFIYLTWGEHPDAATFRMFRRAKLLLEMVEPRAMAAATRAGVLEATLSLTDANGGPLCASIRPPAVAWAASSVGV